MWWIPCAEAADLWVYGDVVNLRERPDEGARSVGRMPIGTKLEPIRTTEGWVEVRVTERPEPHAIIGWIRDDLVTDTPLTVKALLAKADADPVDRARWLDRAAALDPWDEAVIEAAGDPTGPIWIAQCDGARIWLVGKADPRTFLVSAPFLDAQGELRSADPVGATIREVAPLTWYINGWTWPRGTLATPYAAPFNAIEDNPNDGWGPREAPASGEVSIVLGACEPPLVGATFTTAPLTQHPTTPAGGAALKAALKEADASVVGAVAHRGPRGGVEVATLRWMIRPSCTDGSDYDTGAVYVWTAADGVATEPFTVNFEDDLRPGTGTAAWYTWRGIHVGFLYGAWLDAVTSVIRLDAAGHGTLTHLPFRYLGC